MFYNLGGLKFGINILSFYIINVVGKFVFWFRDIEFYGWGVL